MPAKKKARYAVSVSGNAYCRLRHAVDGSIPAFVDSIVESMFKDETILNRIMSKCLLRKEL